MSGAETKMLGGGCFCGAIRFAASVPAANPHTCSCRLCQRHTGALTAAWSECSSRAFCAACGSSIGAVDDAPVTALLLGCFDVPDALDLEPVAHSFEDGRPGWWQVEARGGDGLMQADPAGVAKA